MGLEYKGPWGHFAPVKVNDTLSMDFDNRENFQSSHYAFIVSDDEFDAILGRVQDEGVRYGSGPGSQDNMEINHLHQGRGFYFRDVNGHSWEVILRVAASHGVVWPHNTASGHPKRRFLFAEGES